MARAWTAAHRRYIVRLAAGYWTGFGEEATLMLGAAAAWQKREDAETYSKPVHNLPGYGIVPMRETIRVQPSPERRY